MAKEYIEREAALRAIGYMSIEPSKEPDIIELTLLTAQKVLKKIPAADVVEVVRCKDCKHYSYEQSIHRYECNIFNGAYEFIGYPTKPNDFCSYGERKG